MKKMLVADEEYEAEKIVKSESEIIGYTNGQEVFKHSGIRNMDAFTLDDGAKWDHKDLSEKETLEAFKKRLDETENALLSLIDMSLMGGI